MPKRLNLPDVRDGPTHRERIERWCLRELQKEHGGQIPNIAELIQALHYIYHTKGLVLSKHTLG